MLRKPDGNNTEDETEDPMEWENPNKKREWRRRGRIMRRTEGQPKASLPSSPSLPIKKNKPEKSNTTRSNTRQNRRAPKNAAVSIKGRSEDFSYADALKKARQEIDTEEMGIGETRVRKTANGGILIESGIR